MHMFLFNQIVWHFNIGIDVHLEIQFSIRLKTNKNVCIRNVIVDYIFFCLIFDHEFFRLIVSVIYVFYGNFQFIGRVELGLVQLETNHYFLVFSKGIDDAPLDLVYFQIEIRSQGLQEDTQQDNVNFYHFNFNNMKARNFSFNDVKNFLKKKKRLSISKEPCSICSCLGHTR